MYYQHRGYVATDVVLLKHQDINIHSADLLFIVIHIKILHLLVNDMRN